MSTLTRLCAATKPVSPPVSRGAERRSPRRTLFTLLGLWIVLGGPTGPGCAATGAPPTTVEPTEHRHERADVFLRHVDVVENGRIDWTDGVIFAEGLGLAKGTDEQQRKMARRAAEIVAARNALKIAQDLSNADEPHRAGAPPVQRIRVRGVIRGHTIVAGTWMPEARPPECRVTLRVPFWGVFGAGGDRPAATPGRATVVLPGSRKSTSGPSTTAPAADSGANAVAEPGSVLIIDARGLGAIASPAVVVTTHGGKVLCSAMPPSSRQAARDATVRFVESDVPFAQFREMEAPAGRNAINAERTTHDATGGSHAGGAAAATSSARPHSDAGTAAAPPPAPVRPPAGPWIVVRAARFERSRGAYWLAESDAERAASREAATAMQAGRVWIVVDPAPPAK